MVVVISFFFLNKTVKYVKRIKEKKKDQMLASKVVRLPQNPI